MGFRLDSTVAYSVVIGSHRTADGDERTSTMKKNMRLPRDSALEPDELRSLFIDNEDVEGHGLPITVPSLGTRVPGHGGENIPSPVDDDDVEGHKRH